MDVPCGHGITDAEKLEVASGVGVYRLRRAGNKRFMIHLATVRRLRTQVEIQLIQRARAMVDDDLINHALTGHVAVVAADSGKQAIAVTHYGIQPPRHKRLSRTTERFPG